MRLRLHIFPARRFRLPSGHVMGLGDPSFRAEVVSELRRSVLGRRVPVLLQHEQNGKSYGDVVDVVEEDDGIYAVAEVGQALQAMHERGEARNASAFYVAPLESDDPDVPDFKHALLEVSVVGSPHFTTGQQPIHEARMRAGVQCGHTLACRIEEEDRMADPKQNVALPEDTLAALTAGLEEMRGVIEAQGADIAAMKAQLAAGEDEKPPADGEGDGAPAPAPAGEPDDEEMSKLKAENAALRAEAMCAKAGVEPFKDEVVAIMSSAGVKAAQAFVAKVAARSKPADGAGRFDGVVAKMDGIPKGGDEPPEDAHTIAERLSAQPEYAGKPFSEIFPIAARMAHGTTKEA